MSIGKMSPRQKMINMMYLVLLALLALNVSKEVLKAFHLMEVSFDSTGKNHNHNMQVALTGDEIKIGGIRASGPGKLNFLLKDLLVLDVIR